MDNLVIFIIFNFDQHFFTCQSNFIKSHRPEIKNEFLDAYILFCNKKVSTLNQSYFLGYREKFINYTMK